MKHAACITGRFNTSRASRSAFTHTHTLTYMDDGPGQHAVTTHNAMHDGTDGIAQTGNKTRTQKVLDWTCLQGDATLAKRDGREIRLTALRPVSSGDSLTVRLLD